MKSWPDAHYSNVTLDLEEKDGETLLHLKQIGVPEVEKERTKQGWMENYFGRMKQVFGFGAKLF
jgi:activator of HSP90 ATPase